MAFLIKYHGKRKLFFHVSVFFFNLATLTKHCILQVRSYFFVFQAFAFFGKTWTKNDSKIRCRKNIEKLAQLGPKITQKSIKIEMDAPKNLKNCKKNVFDTPEKHQKKESKNNSILAPMTYYLCITRFHGVHPLPQTPSPRGLTAPKQRKGAHARFP